MMKPLLAHHLSTGTVREMQVGDTQSLHTFAYYLCSNTMEAIHLTRDSTHEVMARFDPLPQGEELETLLFQRIIKNFRQRERVLQKPQNTPAPSPEPLHNLWRRLQLEPALAKEHPVVAQKISERIFSLDLDVRLPLLLSDLFHKSRTHISQILLLPETTTGFRIHQGRTELIQSLRREPDPLTNN